MPSTSRTPTGTQSERSSNPIDNAVRWIQHGHFRFVLGSATLGRDRDINGITRHNRVVNNRRRVVFGIDRLPAGRPRLKHADVVGMGVRATNAFVDHVVQRHFGIPSDIHADLNEDGHNAGVRQIGRLPMAHIRELMRICAMDLGCLRLFTLIGLTNALDEVLGVVVANELQRIGNAVNQIVLTNTVMGKPFG